MKKIYVKSLKEFKEKYLPNDVEKEIYDIQDPKELGKRIAEKIYNKNKHILFR